jgi:hypothetical protein
MESKTVAHLPEVIQWDLAGRLGTFTLSDILQMLSFSGKSGTLTLTQGWNSRTISFRQGRICYIAAGTRVPTILELLVRGGHVTRAQLTDVARRGVTNEADVVPHLLQAGVLSPTDVQRCQERQLESTIYSLFLWRNCVYTFMAGDLVLEGGVPVDLDSEHLIIEGTRRLDEWLEISPVVPSVFMIFQRRPVVARSLTDEEAPIYYLIDGVRDVATIAQEAGKTQFDTAKVLFQLVKQDLIEALPPNRSKIIQLFTLAVESIHMKLMMYGYSREALEFQTQLNRFAQDNRLKTRMSGGRVVMTDMDIPVDATALIDLYKLFIGVQYNKFAKSLDPDKAAGLMEGLYRHSDPELRSMMRMYEFFEIDGEVSIDMFEGLRHTA